MHYSRQKLVTIVRDWELAWEVLESNLSFLERPDEWTGTRIRFDLVPEIGLTSVTFTHEGLVPQIECYKGCTGAWTQYLENLATKLNNGK